MNTKVLVELVSAGTFTVLLLAISYKVEDPEHPDHDGLPRNGYARLIRLVFGAKHENHRLKRAKNNVLHRDDHSEFQLDLDNRIAPLVMPVPSRPGFRRSRPNRSSIQIRTNHGSSNDLNHALA